MDLYTETNNQFFKLIRESVINEISEVEPYKVSFLKKNRGARWIYLFKNAAGNQIASMLDSAYASPLLTQPDDDLIWYFGVYDAKNADPYSKNNFSSGGDEGGVQGLKGLFSTTDSGDARKVIFTAMKLIDDYLAKYEKAYEHFNDFGVITYHGTMTQDELETSGKVKGAKVNEINNKRSRIYAKILEQKILPKYPQLELKHDRNDFYIYRKKKVKVQEYY